MGLSSAPRSLYGCSAGGDCSVVIYSPRAAKTKNRTFLSERDVLVKDAKELPCFAWMKNVASSILLLANSVIIAEVSLALQGEQMLSQ